MIVNPLIPILSTFIFLNGKNYKKNIELKVSTIQCNLIFEVYVYRKKMKPQQNIQIFIISWTFLHILFYKAYFNLYDHFKSFVGDVNLIYVDDLKRSC